MVYNQDDDNGSSNGAGPGLPVYLAKQFVAIHVSFSVVAALVYAGTAALLVASRAYRLYIHRLALYLALAGALQALAMGLEAAPTDLSLPDNSTVTVRPRWYPACVLFALSSQYFGLAKAVVMVWICIYVFALVVFDRQLRFRRHEVGGALLVLLVPAALSWEPLLRDSYGLTGAVCWIKGDYLGRGGGGAAGAGNGSDGGGGAEFGFAIKMAFSIVPHCVLAFAGMVLIVSSALSLFRGVLRLRSNSTSISISSSISSGSIKNVRKHHWRALKEVLPLVAYPCVYYLVFLARVIFGFCFRSDDAVRVFNAVGTSLVQVCSVVLLASLFMTASFRAHVRDSLCWTCARGRGGPRWVVTTSSQSEVESKLKGVDPPTESDPLCT